MANFKKICDFFGDCPAAVPALAVAVFKGIFRPMFTMMDKHQDPESKKYAAFREGMTEVVAFLSYLVTSVGAGMLAKPIAKKANMPEKLPIIKNSLAFIAVCITTVTVIPIACNLTLKPIMDFYSKHFTKGKADVEELEEKLESAGLPFGSDSDDIEDIKKLDVVSGTKAVNFNANMIRPNFCANRMATFQAFKAPAGYNMKVGG